MSVLSNEAKNYRYERKFFISEMTRYEIETLVKLNPAVFSEIYHTRFVNNLYFDSIGMQNYFDNIDGVQQRMKVRIRWYERLFGKVEKPVLEVKTRNGLIGRKTSFPLAPFTLDESFYPDMLVDVFNNSEIPGNLKTHLMNLKVSLLNSYRRKYFQSADGRFRITVDSDLEFYGVQLLKNNFLVNSVDRFNSILELKYDCENASQADLVTTHFPFRLTKSSKYVIGLERLYSF